MDKSLYLYCVAEGKWQEGLVLKGIGGESVFTVPTAGLVAVVQECDAPFSSEDSKLVSEWILAHQAVVDLAWEKYETVIPFNFDTVFLAKEGKSARANLIDWLAKEADSLKEKLNRLRGKAEYGIQISWNPDAVAPRVTRNDAEIIALQEEIRSQSKGTAYLLTQKLGTMMRERLERAADAYFKEFFQQIRGCVEEIRVEKVRNPPEADRQMLANLSCLLPKGEVRRLGDQLDKIGKIEGFFVRFTGPWPPYSFV